MTALALLRGSKPVVWLLLIAAVLVAILVAGRGLGLRWDPFDMAARRLNNAEARAGAAASDVAARRLELEGMADQAGRLDHHHQQAMAVERATALAEAQARSAHDASIPLDPARADRLLRHDGELCRLAPTLCAAAPTDPAGDGDQAVRSGPPA